MAIRFLKSGIQRRWWQRLLRLGATGSMVLVLAAVTLPWWLPGGWLATRVEQDLSAKLGTAVHVGGLSFSWASGITVKHLSVAQPPGFGDEPLLTAPRVRIGLSPLGVLLDGKVNWMTIEQPAVRIVARPDGQLNLLLIHPPKFKIEARRTSLLAGSVTVVSPDGKTFRLRLADAQIYAQRLNPLGRVTMTGHLDQPGTAATVFADISVDGSDANVSVGFFDLDLSALDIARLANSPLKHLGGRARGQLSVPVHQGAIRGGKLDVQVADLDVQPASGVALPVLPSARLTIEGDVDLAARVADLRHVTVAGAGVELSGHGAFNLSLLEGNWLGVHNLRLTGRADPQALLALAGRSADLPVGMTGPVGIELAYERFDQDISARLVLDATDAAVTVAGQTAKPAGTALQCQLKASCDPRTWQFNLDNTELRLGGNRFVGRGAIANIRRLATLWQSPDHVWTLEELWGEVAALEWSGQMELTDLDSVRSLHPALQKLLAGTRLNGQLAGAWSLNQEGAGSFQSRLALSPDSLLSIAGEFEKPQGVSVELRVGALLDVHRPALREGRVELTCGRGRLELRLTDVTGAADESGMMSAHGNFRADGLEEVARCFARASRDNAAPVPLAGAVTGEFSATWGNDALNIHAAADATQLALAPRGAAVKSAGEPASATMDWRFQRGAPQIVARAAVRAEAGEAKADLQYSANAWSVGVDATINDAAALARRLPAVDGHRLDLEGACTFSARLDGRAGAITAKFSADARDLDIAAQGLPVVKRRGDRLSFSAAGKLIEGDGGRGLILDSIELAAGPIAFNGTAAAFQSPAPNVHGSGVLSISAGPELARLVPTAATALTLLGVSGRVEAGIKLDWQESLALGALEIDATSLSIRPVLGTFSKPAGMPAAVKADLRMGPDRSAVALTNLHAQLSGIEADGNFNIEDISSAPRCTGKLTARIDDAGQLADLVPALAPLLPTGQVELQADDISAQGSDVAIGNIALRLDGVGGRRQGQDVAARGMIRAENVAVNLADPAHRSAVGALRTDDLHIRAAGQDMSLVLDLHDLLSGPRGEIIFLADYIDSAKLDELKPVPHLPATVDENYRRRLMRQTSDLLAQVAARLKGADLTVRADIGMAHDWLDPRTDRRCDVQELALRGTVKDARIDAQFACGVNGGTFLAQLQTDLAAENPELTFLNQVRDMTATEALNAQVAEQFPDNRVLGTLSRDLVLRIPLDQAGAQVMDPRIKARPIGTAVTWMHRGVVSGRAAPKSITAIFPGLNMMAYNYDEMVSFSEYRADGSADNDMVFSAPKYDMYIEGQTGADHVGRYEIGLILLGSTQSAEWNHTYRQGRIPLLRFKAGLEHGRKVNEEVSYLWPNQAAFSMFLKNNIFYRLWLEKRRR